MENAYGQLLAEGYLLSREKKGYFVGPVERVPASALPVCRREERKEPQWRLDLRGSGSGTEGFPFSVWARLTRRVLTERGEELLRAIPHNGVFELRRAIARHLYRFRGMTVDPEQIVVGAGTEYLYNLMIQLLGRERVYGLEDPGYSKAERIYALNGARCLSLPVDGQGVQVEALEEGGLQVLHISPNHQFPTGAVTPITRRQGMLRWAGAKGSRYIIEDDYDSEFHFTGLPIPTLQSIDAAGRVLYVNTFSRTLAPSLRISYLVLPEGLTDRYRERLGFYSCTVPAIEQHTLALFLEEGYFDAHLNRMRIFYRGRRDRVLAAIQASPLAGRCRPVRTEAGLHFLLELDTKRPDNELQQLGRSEGIRLSFLSEFQRRPGRAAPHTLVLNYPGIDLERLPQGLELLAGWLD